MLGTGGAKTNGCGCGFQQADSIHTESLAILQFSMMMERSNVHWSAQQSLAEVCTMYLKCALHGWQTKNVTSFNLNEFK